MAKLAISVDKLKQPNKVTRFSDGTTFNQSISLIATLQPESQIANDMQLK